MSQEYIMNIAKSQYINECDESIERILQLYSALWLLQKYNMNIARVQYMMDVASVHYENRKGT